MHDPALGRNGRACVDRAYPHLRPVPHIHDSNGKRREQLCRVKSTTPAVRRGVEKAAGHPKRNDR
eukprot:355027-Chlamydomonas_euryale.AAC.3